MLCLHSHNLEVYWHLHTLFTWLKWWLWGCCVSHHLRIVVSIFKNSESDWQFKHCHRIGTSPCNSLVGLVSCLCCIHWTREIIILPSSLVSWWASGKARLMYYIIEGELSGAKEKNIRGSTRLVCAQTDLLSMCTERLALTLSYCRRTRLILYFNRCVIHYRAHGLSNIRSQSIINWHTRHLLTSSSAFAHQWFF